MRWKWMESKVGCDACITLYPICVWLNLCQMLVVQWEFSANHHFNGALVIHSHFSMTMPPPMRVICMEWHAVTVFQWLGRTSVCIESWPNAALFNRHSIWNTLCHLERSKWTHPQFRSDIFTCDVLCELDAFAYQPTSLSQRACRAFRNRICKFMKYFLVWSNFSWENWKIVSFSESIENINLKKSNFART